MATIISARRRRPQIEHWCSKEKPPQLFPPFTFPFPSFIGSLLKGQGGERSGLHKGSNNHSKTRAAYRSTQRTNQPKRGIDGGSPDDDDDDDADVSMMLSSFRAEPVGVGLLARLGRFWWLVCNRAGGRSVLFSVRSRTLWWPKLCPRFRLGAVGQLLQVETMHFHRMQ